MKMPSIRRTDLTYNIFSGELKGAIDGISISCIAGAGGRAGSKVEGALNWRLANNPLATHIGGSKSKGTHNFGPITIGRYTMKTHEIKDNWIRLEPQTKNIMYERLGFAIHGRGQIGSHGCIVPNEFKIVQQLVGLLCFREGHGAEPPVLEVIAVGTDVDKKFRAV